VYTVLAANYAKLPTSIRPYVPGDLAGWPEVGRHTAELVETQGIRHRLVVADDYYLAAQIAFSTRGVIPVFNLDEARINRHGRALSHKIWQLDEAGLVQLHTGEDALVVVWQNRLDAEGEESLRQRLDDLFLEVEHLDDLSLFEGERRYRFYLGTGVRAGSDKN
jgi:hypothetical protein